MTSKTTLLSFFALAVAAGCARPNEVEVVADDAALDAPPTVARHDYPTQANGIAMLRGFTPLFEQTTDVKCVDATSGAMRVQASGVTSRLDYVLVSSRAELAKELGIDLDLKVKYGLGSVNPSFAFVDGVKENGRSVFLLVTAAQTYKVSRAPDVPVDITPDAIDWSNNPSQFLPACGSHYIDGITHGARLLLGLRFDVDSLAAANEVKGGLGVGVAVGPVGVGADFGIRVKNAITKSGARVSLSIASQGYLIEKDGHQVDATADAVKAVLGDSFTDDTVTGLHGLIESMGASIKNDLCRDAPDSTGCEGGGPGYLANPSRRAAVIAVDLRPYATLPSAPRGERWIRMANALKSTDDTLRGLSPLASRIAAVHATEIRPFLDASDADKARYGLKSDTAHVRDTSELVAKASEWDARFRPHAGTDLKPLEDKIEDCFVSASAGVFSACDPTHAAAEHAAAKAAFDRYQREGRVLPLAYVPLAPMTFNAAKTSCPRGLRLPNRYEADQMAPAVRRAADLPTGGDLARTIWHSGPSEWCTAFYNPPGAGSSASLDRCVKDKAFATVRLPSFCVGDDGPFAR